MGYDYLSLKRELEEARLFERQYAYYALNAVFLFSMLALGVLVQVTVANFALQLLNAVFLAFVFVRFGMLMHDAGHQQIFRSPHYNDLAGVIAGSFAQISSSSWTKGHNIHHDAPNKIGDDPDIDIPFLAYSEEEALRKKGLFRFVAKYQAFLWLAIMMTAALAVRFNHTAKLAIMAVSGFRGRKGLFYSAEFILLMLSNAAFFFLVFSSMSVPKGVIFVIVNYIACGLYIGTVFATNHKAMPLVKEKLDFVRRQVLTTRNVRGSPLIDFWTGGLNYQIEHHLFQTMPRNNLCRAKKYVEAFCRNNGIEYYETGFFRSYREILQNFHSIGAVLRADKAAAKVPASS